MADIWQNEHSFDDGFGIDERFCSRCNMSLSEFLSTGVVGCSECYKQFENEIKNNLLQSQGSIVHIGKLALKRSSKIKLNSEIDRLEKEKLQAVKDEDFILAETIKKQIEKLKGELQ